jgi:hypothetical protein
MGNTPLNQPMKLNSSEEKRGLKARCKTTSGYCCRTENGRQGGFEQEDCRMMIAVASAISSA